MIRLAALQQRNGDWDERIIGRYRQMFEKFFAERHLISGDRYCEVSFDELSVEPERVIGTIYEALGLQRGGEAEARLRTYLSEIGEYQPNRFTPLAETARVRLRREWERCFDEWHYPSSDHVRPA